MGWSIRRLTSAVTALAVVLAVAPAAALASPRTDRDTSAAPRRAAARLQRGIRATVLPDLPPDAWDKDAFDDGDDIPAGARDLTSYVTGANPPNGFGKAPHEEAHTFYQATNETTAGAGDAAGDQDWFFFDVSLADWTMGKPYLVEAQAGNEWVDPVIEVYGPTTVGTIPAVDPEDSVDASGFGISDSNAIASSDNGYWYAAGLSASVTFVPSAAGRYFVRVRPYFDGTGAFLAPPDVRGYNFLSGAGPYTMRVKAGQMTRVKGAGRVQTAIALSQERYAEGELPLVDPSGQGTVILANGWNFPDALAGSTLAGAVSGPLLLTHQTYLDDDVKAEIQRLGATRVFLLGSTAALTGAVETAAHGVPGVTTVTRIAGGGRVQTAAAIGAQAQLEYGVAPVAFVANGWSFPDALAASPMAAYNVAPILLTHKDDLDPDTLAAIRDLGVTDVVVLGSPAAVGSRVFDDLKSELGASHVLRIGGSTRYETMKNFAFWATGSQGATDFVGTPGTAEEDRLWTLDETGFGVAAGWNYPDALGGGAFAGLAGYPLLLNPQGDGISPYILDIQNTLPAGSAYLNLTPSSRGYVGRIGRSYLIGGSSAVGDGVWGGLDSLLKLSVVD